MSKRDNNEEVNQYTVIEWASWYKDLKWLHASLNGAFLGGTKIQRAKQWIRLKKGGAKTGVHDLFLPKARNGYHGLYIEMKRDDGKGVISDEQQEFADDLMADGYLCVFCHGADEAIEAISNYMGIKRGNDGFKI